MRIVKGNGQFIVNGKDVPRSFFGSTVIDQVTKWGMTKIRVFCVLAYPLKKLSAEAIQYFNNFPIWWLKAVEQLVMLNAELVFTFALSFVGLRALGSSVHRENKTRP